MIRWTLVIILLAKSVRAGEWQTTSGQVCVDKCRYHEDEYYFYWCHVSDPSRVFSESDGSFWSETNSPGTHLKWDYCVPSQMDKFNEIM